MLRALAFALLLLAAPAVADVVPWPSGGTSVVPKTIEAAPGQGSLQAVAWSFETDDSADDLSPPIWLGRGVSSVVIAFDPSVANANAVAQGTAYLCRRIPDPLVITGCNAVAIFTNYDRGTAISVASGQALVLEVDNPPGSGDVAEFNVTASPNSVGALPAIPALASNPLDTTASSRPSCRPGELGTWGGKLHECLNSTPTWSPVDRDRENYALYNLTTLPTNGSTLCLAHDDNTWRACSGNRAMHGHVPFPTGGVYHGWECIFHAMPTGGNSTDSVSVRVFHNTRYQGSSGANTRTALGSATVYDLSSPSLETYVGETDAAVVFGAGSLSWEWTTTDTDGSLTGNVFGFCYLETSAAA